MERQPESLVIGAGPAGLAVAACLRKRGLPFDIVEQADCLGASWRGHYDRLHLHTDKGHSALPYLDFPTATPRYPSRDQMIAYLEQYARDLVVGLGNSGGEIAVDLCEHGARVALAVRGAVNVIPREILGLPVLTVSIALSRLPARLADLLAAPLIRFTIGDLSKLNLRKPLVGPITQVVTSSRVPLIDIGTLKCVREGRIEVVGDVRSIGDARSIGFQVSATGMLRDIGIEARRIAQDIARRRRH